MMETKTEKEFIDRGFGFPVHLLNVPMIKVRGVWTPKIDYNALAKVVLHALTHKPSPLSGSEVAFIRLHFEMTFQEFATRFAVSHPAVIKWEKAKSHPTKMNWTTEKDIRLFILSKLSADPSKFAGLYGELQTPAKNRATPIQVDGMKIAA
jgi:hypothetical protein